MSNETKTDDELLDIIQNADDTKKWSVTGVIVESSEKIADMAESHKALKQMNNMLYKEKSFCLAYTGKGEELASKYGVNDFNVGNFLATIIEGIKEGKINLDPLYE